MKKISEPNISESIFAICANNVRDNDLREKLLNIEGVVKECEDKYREKLNNDEMHIVSEFEKSTWEGVTGAELNDLYSKRLVKGKQSEQAYYNYIKTNGGDSCPYCKVGKVSNVDHYLPKKKFPIFSVSQINLIPSCRDCNYEKKEYFGNTAENTLLHPYKDDVSSEMWINTDVYEKNEGLIFTFKVTKPSGWDDVLCTRIQHHLDYLKLNDTYAVNAASEVQAFIPNVISVYKSSGLEEAKEYVVDALESQKGELNTWKRGMYRGLCESEWFFNEWLPKQTD